MRLAVITPVGPGHRASFDAACAPSVARAEAFDPGPFSQVLHYAMDDGEGLHGRSARRNDGIDRAVAEGADANWRRAISRAAREVPPPRSRASAACRG